MGSPDDGHGRGLEQAMIDTQAIEHLMQELYAAAGTDDVVAVLDQVEALWTDNGLVPSDAFSLYRQGFQILQDLTVDDSATAERLIVDQLLPICLSVPSDQDLQYEVSKCRDSLRAWLDQYPDPRHSEIRALVLDKLHDALSSDDSEAACFTIATIGYRRDDDIAALRAIAREHNGSDGDAALSTLVALGVPDVERATVLAAIHRRAMTRHGSLLLSAMYFLADPATIPVFEAWLDTIEGDGLDFPRALVLQALARIADRADGDSALQDRVWGVIQQDIEKRPDSSGQTVYYNPSIAPVCESPQAISSLLKMYSQNSDQTGLDTYHRHLLQLRLQECVRPRHLKAWASHEHDHRLLRTLHEDALANSEQMGLHRGVSGDIKVGAWDLLLRLRDGHILGHADEALARETSPSVRYEVCETIACFRLPSIPTIVREWVTSRYELTDPATREQGGYRGSAIDVVRGVGTRAAFDTLITAGLSIHDNAYRDVADALSELAVALARGGDASVAPTVLQAARDGKEPFQRAAASVALAALAAHGFLSTDMSGPIAALLADGERSAYERSMLLRALDIVEPVNLSGDGHDALSLWAHHDDDWLGWRSLEILAYRQLLQNDPELMRRQLGLEKKGGKWIVAPSAKLIRWGGLILGVLYRNAPTLFEGAVVDSLRSRDWGHVAQLLEQLRLFVQASETKRPPRPIADALLARLLEQQNAFSSETDLLAAVAEFIPDRLVTEIGDDAWTTWRAEARMALADALGEASNVGSETEGRGVHLLQALTRDAQYAVRRAAYRALSHVSRETLQVLCEVGAQAIRSDVRQRAAEGCVWLGDDDQSGHVAQRTLDALSEDREPSVRDTANRVRVERRERLWAAAYLNKVCEVNGVGIDVLDVWAYGQALVRVGDDATLRRLDYRVKDAQLPPHIRHWLGRIHKAVRQRWDKVTADWPEPWTMIEGRLDAGTGEIETTDGQRRSIPYVLWSRPARNLDEEIGSWGGIAEYMPSGHGEPLTLHFHNGEQRRIYVTHNVISNVGGGSADFDGDGPYPV